MRTIRSVLAMVFALALSAGVTACDPGSDEPRLEPTTGDEKPEREDGIIDDEEGLVDDDTFGSEGIIDDQTFDDDEGLIDDDTF